MISEKAKKIGATLSNRGLLIWLKEIDQHIEENNGLQHRETATLMVISDGLRRVQDWTRSDNRPPWE